MLIIRLANLVAHAVRLSSVVVFYGEGHLVFGSGIKNAHVEGCLTFKRFDISIVSFRLHYIADRIVSAKHRVINARYSEMFAKHSLIVIEASETLANLIGLEKYYLSRAIDLATKILINFHNLSGHLDIILECCYS